MWTESFNEWNWNAQSELVLYRINFSNLYSVKQKT
jgi:hypothetical protein